jgi:hypothetical protein
VKPDRRLLRRDEIIHVVFLAGLRVPHNSMRGKEIKTGTELTQGWDEIDPVAWRSGSVCMKAGAGRSEGEGRLVQQIAPK